VEKKPEQVYLQCWHGTPFKRLGADIEVSGQNKLYTNDQMAEKYRSDAARYSWMLAQSEWAAERLRSSFRLDISMPKDASLIVEGYPRNDRLIGYTDEAVRYVREKYGVPDGKTVLLYAPTWRENQYAVGTGFLYRQNIDIDKLMDDLGDEYFLLFRSHYFAVSEEDHEKYSGFFANATEEEDITDLYPAADALITDYSSVFFDYANLGKPILYYMYDLETYKDRLRGFYMGEGELPGPISQTQEELTKDIRRLPEIAKEYAERIVSFRAKFCPLDDGHASERVVSRVFSI
jgi:CDP-glycerol glycerophosphotransferase